MLRLIGIAFCSALLITKVNAQIVISDNRTPEKLVMEVLIGKNSGIKVENVKYTGHPKSIGGFVAASEYLPVKTGLILSTGFVADADGPNEKSNAGTKMFTDGSISLQQIATKKTMDAAVLQFVFYPNTTEISFEYSFASEEYPEYVNMGVNDVFAFFISGLGYNTPTNIALLPDIGKPVSVDNVNAEVNSNFFIENWPWKMEDMSKYEQYPEYGERAYNCEFDGMTVLLEAKAKVVPYKPYLLQFAIADAGDNLFDSGVFLKKSSLKSSGNKLPVLTVIKDDIKRLNDSLDLLQVKCDTNEIKIISNIQFKFNSSELNSEYTHVLDKLAEFFNQYFDINIKIEGFADNIGDDDYNLNLSKKRAQIIYNYLLTKEVGKSRLSFEGKGNTCPVYKGSDMDKKAVNRRVEFILN